MSRSYVQRHQQPALAAMTPARRLRMFRAATASALIKLPERRRRQARKLRGSNESLRVCLRTGHGQRAPDNRTSPTFANTSALCARTPTVSNDGASGFTPATDTKPCDGRKPQIPQLLAGTRVEPPGIRSQAQNPPDPHATAEADPLDDPPGTRSGARGLRGVP